jgi:hypothetical protein
MIHLVNGAMSDEIYHFIMGQLRDKVLKFPSARHLMPRSAGYFIDTLTGEAYKAYCKGWVYDEDTGESRFGPGDHIPAYDLLDAVEANGLPLGAFKFVKES